ncbi:MAG: hypothetical protein KAU62_16920 [Candidatus Heimdallarchaeota archaeon]|nr:hypothetical protein [Candidatus Heimdallarchaeota archaeon]MCG3257791.1 hypothetical protein [Candidatus Heimdallarchaeota archaeon]MCK4612841.1 hypothetical protein [Candidatus Heimdallarchaeota archaeon]
MSTRTQIDVEALNKAKAYGEENKHLVHLGATKGRLIRSKTQILILEARAVTAKKERTDRLKEMIQLEKFILSFPKYAFTKKEQRFEKHLKKVMQGLAVQYASIIPQLKEKYAQESREELRWQFVQRQTLLRTQDEQIMRFTHDDAGDLLVKLATLSGAKVAQKKKSEKPEKEEEVTIDE